VLVGLKNNNNNKNRDDVYGAGITTKVIARVHPVLLMNAERAPTWAASPRRNKGRFHPQFIFNSPSPFVLIAQPVS